LSDPSQSAGSGSVAEVRGIRNMVVEDTRLASCPDESQVNRRRQEERSQGGPSVPHNSMDSSLVDLSETVELIHDGEVFGNAQSNTTNISNSMSNLHNVISNIETMALAQEEEETEITYEAEISTDIIVIGSDDESEVENEITGDHENSGDPLSAAVDDTIDLTESPLPSRRASIVSREANGTTTTYNDDMELTEVVSREANGPTTVNNDDMELTENGPTNNETMEMISNDLDTTSNFDEEAMRSFCASLKCPICFDSFQVLHRKGTQLCSTICGHVLCLSCARVCINGKDECPTCRKKLPRNSPYNYHPLFIF